MTESTIKFATDILRHLGEELTPSPSQGIIELVKNAYDADASTCTVELRQRGGRSPTLRVSDDGDGMTQTDITTGWLVLGQSLKSSRRRTRKGRIPAGSKGLGRLAALRLGRNARMTTRPRAEPSAQYSVDIDWQSFDSHKLVSDIGIPIMEADRPPNTVPGTDIAVTGLKRSIGRMEVKRLARALILLADPFDEDPAGFSPRLLTPEFADLERIVANRYFTQADYHLIAELDEHGNATARVVDWRDRELFSGSHAEIATRDQSPQYDCPPATFELWAFILSSTNFATRPVTIGEVRDWLNNFGGVHLYVNGLRVAPYGNAGNDWLDMNLRRVRSPEERPGTNTAIGRVLVKDIDDALRQKTDRSGIIEDVPFVELRQFAIDSLEWMARRRMAVAEDRRRRARQEASRRSSATKDAVEDVIEEQPKPRQQELRRVFRSYNRSRDREVGELRKEVQLYRTLSTAGITAAIFAHESSGNPIKAIGQAINSVERRARQAMPRDKFEGLEGPIGAIKRALQSLSVLGTATLNLINYEKRRLGRVEVHRVLNALLESYAPFLDGRGVVVERDLSAGNPYLRGSEAAVESVFTNLINNSLQAFETGGTRKRIIRISSERLDGVLLMHFSDSGPGISGISEDDIWLPGQTTRPNGTGLGLTIVKDSMSDLGGSVKASSDGSLGGAVFTVEFPIIGA